MVAELLRLKARLLVNGFRRAPSRILGSVVLVAIAVLGLALLFVVASRVTEFDGEIVGRTIVLVGAEVSLGALFLPAMFSRSALVEPRAFLGYRIRSEPLAAALLLLTLVGPAALLIAVALAPAVAWRSVPGATGTALAAAPLLVLQLLLLVRIGVAVGAWAGSYPLARWWVRLVGIVVLVTGTLFLAGLLLPRAVLLAPERSLAALSPIARFLAQLHPEQVSDVLAGSPLASLWGAPGLAVSGLGQPGGALWIGAAVIVVLAMLWWGLVAGALRPTRAQKVSRAERVPGWFRRMPATPAGAVAARSFIYWLRDPRYRVVFGILPLLPILTVLAFVIGGVPPRVGAFVPLPLMVLVLAWSTIHNDIAYDSTAVWSHVVAQTRGLHDRLGRVWPVLAFGVILIAVGTPITAWAQGDPDAVPAVLGITLALLLGGVGVGSAMSARFPYPAPRPGDGPFTYPQATGSTGGAAQAGSFLLTIVVALPPIAATTLWLMGFPGPLPWIALAVGLVSGAIALALGLGSGASAFDRRGPELLAFTMQN
ncbi:MAG TPA: ABC transporter permease [Pseudolysinimonas sp.]|nr:ABC transporter permease [Pseudolysinimonas sp.]